MNHLAWYNKPSPPPIHQPPTTVPTPIPPPTPPKQPVETPKAPTPTPVAPSAPAGGNGQIYCSGPSAPGWRVDLPGGGCSPGTGVTVATPTVIKLNQLPYTGGGDVVMSTLFYFGIAACALAAAFYLLITEIASEDPRI